MKRLGIITALIALLFAAAVAVWMGGSEDTATLSSALELWSDVVRDADQLTLQATRVSVRDENRLGRDLARQIPYQYVMRPELDPNVAAVGARVAAHAKRQGIRYEFHVVDLDVPNAFAFPGGPVIVTTGLLNALESEAELAAVLGHEIAHVDLRHAVEGYQYALKLEKIHAHELAHISRAMRAFVAAGYTKQQELEADAQGILMSVRAGYDPEAAARLFQRLEKASGEHAPARSATPVGEVSRALREAPSVYFRTHPWFRDRARQAAELGAKHRRNLNGAGVPLER